MKLFELARKVERLAEQNSPTILTVFGVTGTISTAYLTGKAAYRSVDIIRNAEVIDPDPDEILRLRDKAKLVWKLYIPASVSGVVTVACIVTASRVASRRTAAIAAAYSLTETAFTEYREKIVETLGEGKEKKVRDQLAQDKVNGQQPSGMLIIGTGKVLCCEMFTGRYFESDMESLRKAQNDINAKLLRDDVVPLSEFYHLVGLSYTDYSGEIGWTSDKMLDLDFATVLTEDNKPCMVFSYNYTIQI